MSQGELEDFVKNLQKMMEHWREVSIQLGAIGNSISKNMEGVILGIERITEPIRMLGSEGERAIDSVKNISDAIGKAHMNDLIPEKMAENIRNIAEGLTQQMKPIVKIISEWQDLTKNG